jgi:hypothetical protein
LQAVLDMLSEIMTELATLGAEVAALRGAIQPSDPRASYSTEEAAAMLGKAEYTVREWCRLGRIAAEKRPERRGGAEVWRIPAAGIKRYRDEGLLPLRSA